MPGFALSVEADGDLLGIYQYTDETWGAAQAAAYIRGLFQAFERLAATPGLGRARPELREGIRSHPHRQHVIYYAPLDGGIGIARVLHGSMDTAPSHFDVAFGAG